MRKKQKSTQECSERRLEAKHRHASWIAREKSANFFYGVLFTLSMHNNGTVKGTDVASYISS